MTTAIDSPVQTGSDTTGKLATPEVLFNIVLDAVDTGIALTLANRHNLAYCALALLKMRHYQLCQYRYMLTYVDRHLKRAVAVRNATCGQPWPTFNHAYAGN